MNPPPSPHQVRCEGSNCTQVHFLKLINLCQLSSECGNSHFLVQPQIPVWDRCLKPDSAAPIQWTTLDSKTLPLSALFPCMFHCLSRKQIFSYSLVLLQIGSGCWLRFILPKLRLASTLRFGVRSWHQVSKFHCPLSASLIMGQYSYQASDYEKAFQCKLSRKLRAVSVTYTTEPGRREAQCLKQMGNKTIEDLWHWDSPTFPVC